MGLMDAIRRARAPGRAVLGDGDPGPPIDLQGKRVLVVYLFRALGDAVLLAPAIQALFDAGAGSVDVLVQKGAARILKYLDVPWKLHVLPEALDLGAEDPRDKKSPWRAAEVKEAAAALEKKLARRKFDVAIELTARADVDGRRWVKASKATHRLGWITSHETAAQAGLTFGTLDTRTQTDRHWSRTQILPMRCLGVSSPSFAIPFAIPDKARDRSNGMWSGEPRVVIVPGSRQEERRWRPECFARVGRWVTEERGGSVVVCGAPDERKLAREVAKAIGPGAEVYANQDLGALLALLEGADAVVTNDTGPMHFAFLMRRPTLAIFTLMSPVAWGPPVQDKRYVVMTAQDRRENEDADEIQARAAIHYLEGLLACVP